MKKSYVFIVVMLFSGLFIGAQDVEGFSMSLGFEGNGYSPPPPEALGFGLRLGGDYRFNEMFSVGASAMAASDFGMLATFEFSGILRVYYLRSQENLIQYHEWQPFFHLFAQFSGGAAVLQYYDSKGLKAMPSFSVEAGCRIVFNEYSSWYIEPYIRGGYPVIFGAGILAVYRFPFQGVFW
jgi:hypothetical protein